MGRPKTARDEPSGDHAPLHSVGTAVDEPFRPEAEVAVAVVEQRVSNLSQGAMCLVLLTGPFLHVLGLIPRGVYVLWSASPSFAHASFKVSSRGFCEPSLLIMPLR